MWLEDSHPLTLQTNTITYSQPTHPCDEQKHSQPTHPTFRQRLLLKTHPFSQKTNRIDVMSYEYFDFYTFTTI